MLKIKTDIKKLFKAPRKFTSNTIHIFTDGSCERCKQEGDKGTGGWGAVMLFNDNKKEIYGGQSKTTNNEMELMAIYQGLKAVKNWKYPVIVYSDSQYSINCVSVWAKAWERRGWRTATGQPVKNAALISSIVKLAEGRVIFKWVKGHIGIEHNERADVLATQGRKEYGRQ